MSPHCTGSSMTTGKPASRVVDTTASPKLMVALRSHPGRLEPARNPERTVAHATPGQSPVAALQLLQIVEGLIHRADDGPRHPPRVVELSQQHQVVEIRRRLQLAAQLGP